MGAQKSAEGQISFKMPVFKGTDLMAGFNAAEIGAHLPVMYESSALKRHCSTC